MDKLVLCSLCEEEIQNELNNKLRRTYIFKIEFSGKEIKEDLDLCFSDFCENNNLEYEINDICGIDVHLYKKEDLKKLNDYCNSIMILQKMEDKK